MDIQLSPLTAADGPAVVDLFNHYAVHSFAAFPEDPLPYPFFDRLMEAAAGWPTLAAKGPDGRLLGFALLRRHNPWPTCSHVAEITYFVAPDSTGQGIGSRMLAELEARARNLGIRTILAAIASLNSGSLAFHSKHGFVEVGRFRNVCIKRGTPFDAVWMQKTL
ncbi:MAG: N-acetyltransferase [Planctomycetes bacterium]|nr:N-acetyltransferase [Planctomycetota bacterium]